MNDFIYIFQKGFNYSQDGPGNRLVYHLSGCNLYCPWCSNPEGLKQNGNSKKYSLEEVFNEIISSRMMFFENGGVTFTGGEVTLQKDSVFKLCKMLKKENISTCIETNASLINCDLLFDTVDYMISDFKSPNKELLKAATGADIEIIKENLLKRAKSKKYLLIRIPLINNFNTGEKNAKEFAEFFKELQDKGESNKIYIEILTYHEYGKDKYEKLNLKYNFSDGFVTQAQVDILKTELEKNNLKIIKT
jgi:pyruvate formate lyase activating enzyme